MDFVVYPNNTVHVRRPLGTKVVSAGWCHSPMDTSRDPMRGVQ